MGRRKKQREQREPVPFQSIHIPSSSTPIVTESALIVANPSSQPQQRPRRNSSSSRPHSTSPLKQRAGRRGRSPLRFLRRKFTRSCSPLEQQQMQQQRRHSSIQQQGGAENHDPYYHIHQLVPVPDHHHKTNTHGDGAHPHHHPMGFHGNQHHNAYPHTHPNGAYHATTTSTMGGGGMDMLSPLTQRTFYSKESSDGNLTNRAVIFEQEGGGRERERGRRGSGRHYRRRRHHQTNTDSTSSVHDDEEDDDDEEEDDDDDDDNGEAKIVIYSGSRHAHTQPQHTPTRRASSSSDPYGYPPEGGEEEAEQPYVTVSFPAAYRGGGENQDDHHHHNHNRPNRTTLTIFPTRRDETEIVFEQQQHHHHPQNDRRNRSKSTKLSIQPVDSRDSSDGGYLHHPHHHATTTNSSVFESAWRNSSYAEPVPELPPAANHARFSNHNQHQHHHRPQQAQPAPPQSSSSSAPTTSGVGHFFTSARARFGRKFSQKNLPTQHQQQPPGSGGLPYTALAAPTTRQTKAPPQTYYADPYHHHSHSPYHHNPRSTTSELPSFDMATTCSAASTSIALLEVDEPSPPRGGGGGGGGAARGSDDDDEEEPNDHGFPLHCVPPRSPTTMMGNHPEQDYEDDEEEDDSNHEENVRVREECKEEITEVAIDALDEPSAMTENPQADPAAPPARKPHASGAEGGTTTAKKPDHGVPKLLEVDVSRKRLRRGNNFGVVVKETPSSAAAAGLASNTTTNNKNKEQDKNDSAMINNHARSESNLTPSATMPQEGEFIVPVLPKQQQQGKPQTANALNNVVVSEEPTTSSNSASLSNTVIFLLLLDPKSKFFELIRVQYPPASTTIGDLLAMIPQNATEPALAEQRYNGVIRPRSYARAWTDKKQLASATPNQSNKDTNPSASAGIEPGEILIAIPYEYATKYVCRLGRQILANSRIQSLLETIETSAATANSTTNAAPPESPQPSPQPSSTVPPAAAVAVSAAAAAAAATTAAENRKKRRLSPGRSPASTPNRRSSKQVSHPKVVDVPANNNNKGVQPAPPLKVLNTANRNSNGEPAFADQEHFMVQTPKGTKDRETAAQVAALSSIAQAATSIRSTKSSDSIPSMIHSHTTTNVISPPADDTQTWTMAPSSSAPSVVASCSAGTNSLNLLRLQLQQEHLQEQMLQQQLAGDDEDSASNSRLPAPLGPLVQQKIHELEERFQNASTFSQEEDDEEEDCSYPSLETAHTATETSKRDDSVDQNWQGRDPRNDSDLLTAPPKTIKRENRSLFNQHQDSSAVPRGRYSDFGGCRSSSTESTSTAGNMKSDLYSRQASAAGSIAGSRSRYSQAHDHDDNSSLRSRRSQRSDHMPLFHQHSHSSSHGGRFDDNESQWSIDMSYSSWSRSVDSSLAHRRLMDGRAGSRAPSLMHHDPHAAISYSYGRRHKQKKIIRKMRRYLAAGLIFLIFLYTFDSSGGGGGGVVPSPDGRFLWSSWHPQPKTNGPLGLFGFLQFAMALVALIKFQLFLQQSPDAECKCPLIQGCAIYIDNLRRRKRASRRGE
ncbi:hypothetical protein ACA910_020537 [Epithemia clementina (nom. ined.)]